jgi:hypothetical protein
LGGMHEAAHLHRGSRRRGGLAATCNWATFQYHIKHTSELYERIVGESELREARR